MLYNKILNRRSERFYTDQKLDQQTKEEIVNVINSSATSINAHGFSAIMIENQETLNELSKLNWNQPHIAKAAAMIVFVTDINRTKLALSEESFKDLSEEMRQELIMVGAVDATISATTLTTYLLDKGIGSCFLGGVRTYPKQLQSLLNLDENTIPVVGLSIGYIEKQNECRPKLNKVFVEKYDQTQLIEEVKRYDEVMLADYEKRDQVINWSQNTKNTYVNFDKMAGYVDIDNLYKKIIKAK